MRHRGRTVHLPRDGLGAEVPGWLAVYHEGEGRGRAARTRTTRRTIPRIAGSRGSSKARSCTLEVCCPANSTSPSRRRAFSEATLVKELEENGIGRPSTYATILSTIQNRDYVEKEAKRFNPTELGLLVNDLMVASFGDIVDVGYTARMEEELDRIEEGKLDWIDALREFQKKFEATWRTRARTCATSSARRSRPIRSATSAASRWC